MKAKIGIVLIVLGSVLLISALSLFLYNTNEQNKAAESVEVIMPQMAELIRQRRESQATDTTGVDEMIAIVPSEKEMPTAEIENHDYIGFVGIPKLVLELPVMADWSYPQIKIAPCRFSGDVYGDDIVIMAHNYVRHFGPIDNLRAGDTVTFTDINGTTTEYTVVVTDVLVSTAVEEMTAGDYDMTLFTCDYSGNSRITVRCDRTLP